MPVFANLYSYIYTRLHWIWLGVAGPVAFTMVFLTPPFQVPDESAHFIRAVQVSRGLFYGEKKDGRPGGNIPKSVLILIRNKGFASIPFHTDVKIDVVNATKTTPYSLEWDPTDVFASNCNTILWPPTNYILQAVGLKLGRWLDFKVLPSFYLARLLNCIGCVLMAFFALRIATGCRWGLVILLAMPMTLFEFASVSQDALLCASAALGTALLSRLPDPKNTGAYSPLPLVGSIFLLFTLLCAGRSPYLPILPAAALLIAINRKDLAKPALLFGLVSILAVVAWQAAVTPLIVSFRRGVDAHMQVQNVVGMPLHFATIFVGSCVRNYPFYRDSFIGVLGWLDLSLPHISYVVYSILIYITIVLGTAIYSKDSQFSRLNLLIIALAFLSASSLVIISQYLMWTPVSEQSITGVQGRYFIPLFLFAVLALKDGKFTRPFLKSLSSCYSLFVVVTICLVDVSTIFSIIKRYYY